MAKRMPLAFERYKTEWTAYEAEVKAHKVAEKILTSKHKNPATLAEALAALPQP